MANILRGGFHPIDQLRHKPRKMSVASGYAPANALLGIARGDVVTQLTDGTIAVLGAGAADALLILGIVSSVSYVDAAGTRQFGGIIPTGHTFAGNANVSNPLAPVVEVIVDPAVEYYACVAVGTTNALAYAGIQANMDLSATSATTVSNVTHESLRTLDGTFIAGTAQFRITDIVRDSINDVTSANYRVKCMINEGMHQFLSLAGI